MDTRTWTYARAIDLGTHPDLERPGLHLAPSTRTLHGPAGPVVVEPRVMQVLLALAGARGDVVPREALLRAGWGPAVVGDDALHRAVAGGRRALRQAGAADWTVETIARVGYRLVGPSAPPAGAGGPTREAAAGAPAAADTPPADTGCTRAAADGASRGGRRWVLGLAAAAGAVAVGVALGSRGRSAAVPATLQDAMQRAQQALRLAQPEADRQAVATLEAALKAHQRHAPAWGLLALARRAAAESAPPGQLERANTAVDEAARRALALDPAQPDALTARALLLPAFGHWAQLDEALQQVRQQHPDHLPTLDATALLWAGTGVLAAHHPLRLKTVTADPLHAGYNFRSIFSHWMNGQLAAADQAGERGLELWPGHLPTWLARTVVLAYTGRADRALPMLDQAPPGLPPPWLAQTRRVWTALAGGRTADRAAALQGALAGLERGGPLAAVGTTMDLAALGEVDLALDVTEAFLLERGTVRSGTHWRPGQPWHVDLRRRFTNHLFLPVTAPLRAHPRFANLMDDIGLAAHWRRSDRLPDHLARPRA